MAVKDKYLDKIVYDYTTSPKSRVWDKLSGGKPSAQVTHDTGNPGSTAKGNSNFFKSTTKGASSAHSFIDDKEIRIIIPLNEKTWQVQYNKPLDNDLWGDDANDIALGHELCYGGSIDFEKAYDMFVWFHVYCAKKYGIPLDRIEGHYKLDPQRRTDPINAFKQYGKTWTGFMRDVKAYFDAWDVKVAQVSATHTDEIVHKIVKNDTLWSIAREHETNVARLKELNPGIDANALQVGSTITVKEIKEQTTPEPVLVDDPQPEKVDFSGKRIESLVDGLNFYDGPRWENPVGKVNKGIGFPIILDKLKVDDGEMYKVQNSKGAVYYITASTKYTKLVATSKPAPKPAPVNPYKGKKLRAKVGAVNFYNTPRWENPSGQVQKGWGFPTIVKKVKVDGADQYQVKNSKGQTFYISASTKYVEIVNQ